MTVAVRSASGMNKGPNVPQGAAWAYDWRLGEDQAFVNACVANGVEYVPMIVSAPLSASPALATTVTLNHALVQTREALTHPSYIASGTWRSL